MQLCAFYYIFRPLSDNEIEKIVEGWCESEDEFFDDDDENNVEIHLSRLLYAEEEADLGERSSAAEELQSNESINVSDLRNLKQKYERTTWKQKEYTMDSNTDFKDTEELADHFLNLGGPCSYFTYFFRMI